jgi:glycosyltransferase involved in cell wall biosynthesis
MRGDQCKKLMSISETDPAFQRGKVALLLWGNVFEDFLDGIGLSLHEFCERMPGGWGFGYVEALRSAGWETILFCTSRQVTAPTRLRHLPSGTPIWALPVYKTYHKIASRMADPDRGSGKTMFGLSSGLRRLNRSVRREIAPYLTTPIGALARHLRCEGCTAIVTQEYEYARFDICVLLGKLLRLPVYATFQGGDRHTGRLEELVRPMAIRAASGLIIGADSEAQRVVQAYGISPKKIWRIPNPINLSVWQPQDRGTARQALALPLEERIAIYHGRIDMRRKGLDVLLDAWRLIRAASADRKPRLLMIGSGRDDAVLREQLARPELSGIQWLAGYELDRTVMQRYLSAADLYVLPSRIEGFPVAPLEAMACGLPIVGTDIPAMSNILEHGLASGGIIVTREDPRALAEAIQRLLDDPALCSELGRSARRNMADRFSIESVGRQFGEMLTQH